MHDLYHIIHYIVRKNQIGFSSRILAYINRSFDVREQLPQFYRCINLASLAAIECAVVVV